MLVLTFHKKTPQQEDAGRFLSLAIESTLT